MDKTHNRSARRSSKQSCSKARQSVSSFSWRPHIRKSTSNHRWQRRAPETLEETANHYGFDIPCNRNGDLEDSEHDETRQDWDFSAIEFAHRPGHPAQGQPHHWDNQSTSDGLDSRKNNWPNTETDEEERGCQHHDFLAHVELLARLLCCRAEDRRRQRNGKRQQ